jgi:hypothetical protein
MLQNSAMQSLKGWSHKTPHESLAVELKKMNRELQASEKHSRMYHKKHTKELFPNHDLPINRSYRIPVLMVGGGFKTEIGVHTAMEQVMSFEHETKYLVVLEKVGRFLNLSLERRKIYVKGKHLEIRPDKPRPAFVRGISRPHTSGSYDRAKPTRRGKYDALDLHALARGESRCITRERKQERTQRLKSLTITAKDRYLIKVIKRTHSKPIEFSGKPKEIIRCDYGAYVPMSQNIATFERNHAGSGTSGNSGGNGGAI